MQTHSGQLPSTKTAPPAVVQYKADGTAAEPPPFTSIRAELAESAFRPDIAPATPQSVPIQRSPSDDDTNRDSDENDELLVEARAALANRRLNAWSVSDILKKLGARSDASAVALRQQLCERCKREDVFWNQYSVKSVRAIIEQHQTGTDDVRYLGPGTFLIHESVDLNRYAAVAEDPRLTQLAQDVDFLQSFYLSNGIYSQELERYHGNIRIMRSFTAAGQPVDWWDYFECENWLEKTVFNKILDPYLNHPIVGPSNVLGRAQSCYNDWQALKLTLANKSPDNSYDETGRGKVKTELMALDAPTPDYTPVDKEQTRNDFDRAMQRGRDALTSKDVFPGDIHTALVKLKMLREHAPYDWDKPKVDDLVYQLEVKFAATDDPDVVKQQQVSSTEVEFDTSQPFGVSKLESVLNTIANESGENGTLSFKISANVTAGTGFLNAYVKGWANIAMSYAVTDTLTCVLGFDASAALGAGISVAGLVSAGVEAGAGFGMKARFRNPTEAATWIYAEMQALNKRLHRPAFRTIDADVDPSQLSPVVLTEKKGFAKGEASGDIGVVAADAEVKGEKTWTSYSKDGEQLGTGTTTTTSFSAGVLARMGPVSLKGGYTYTGDTVVDDINEANNGDYHNHKVNVGFGLSSSITKNPTKELPSQSIQDGVLNFFAKLEGKMPGGLPREALYGSFSSVVKQIYDACEYGKKYNAGVDVDIVFEWHNEKHANDGEYHMQYFRTSVTPTLSASIGQVSKAGGIEVAVNASKTETIFELIGTDNWSYVYQQYRFRWNEEQWAEFVKSNRERLDVLMTNMTNKDSPAYSAQFASMLEGASGFENRLQALEQFFHRHASNASS